MPTQTYTLQLVDEDGTVVFSQEITANFDLQLDFPSSGS